VNDVFWPFSKRIRNPIFVVIYRALDIFGFWRFFLVKKIVKNLSPNIVITNNIFGFGFWIWLAAKYCKVKIYHVSRDYYLSCIRQTCFKDNKACKSVCGICSIYSLPNKLASSLVDHHIAISDYISAYFSNAGFFQRQKKRLFITLCLKTGKLLKGHL